VLSFIQQQGELLGNPVDMDMDWFSKRIPVVLKYYYHILKYYTDKEHGKKFRLAPLCQIKSHFLTIENTVLRERDIGQCKTRDISTKNLFS
jgi:hypothetical protein